MNIDPQEKRDLIKQNDEIVFQQVLLSVFKEYEDGAAMDVIDGATRQIATMQAKEKSKTFNQAPQQFVSSILVKKSMTEKTGRFQKICHTVEKER
jgi:hypothetical protein